MLAASHPIAARALERGQAPKGALRTQAALLPPSALGSGAVRVAAGGGGGQPE